MDLRLPLITSRGSGRLISAWLPHWPEVAKEGVSLSELKDDLALMVMEQFERMDPSWAWRYQTAPHLQLVHVPVDTVARDREDGRAYTLKGRLAVLLEKWPGDAFWVATPTRLSHLQTAVREPADVEKALVQRLSKFCLDRRIENLERWHVERNERLDLLEVDADAPTILPRGALRERRKKPKPAVSKPGEPAKEPEESEEERELRRARARLSVRTLRQIGKNLTHQARDGELARAFGREGLVSQLLEAIELRDGAAVVLVGPSGVGKTAIVHEVVRRMIERQRTSQKRRDVWRIDGNQFIAGMSYVGQWEARARELSQELVDTGDVLFVDDLASLIYAGRHAKGDTHAAQYLEPALGRRELTVLAECTPERFERIREEAPSFAALFDVVQVPQLSRLETLPVLLGAVRELESAEGSQTPRISPDAMELVLELSDRFFALSALPGRAVRLIQRVLAGPGTLDNQVRRYGVKDVYDAVRRETGLPDFVLGGAAPKTRAQIVADLSAQVAGQPEAIDAVADAVLALQLSVQDPEKPLANYLFVGPTGVGKTETAKALARYLFGSSERLVRFDMSELATSSAIARLIGEPGGPDGELITALRTQPFCVLLLDEVEKAHPRVFDTLLQLLGEGRLSDAHGRLADGRNAVVVMTSNLGVREAASQAGFSRADTREAALHYVAAARQFFRPELFNRLDRVVPFRSLDRTALQVVVEHALADLLSRRGVRRSNVLVDVEPELLSLLVEQAYDPRYGARPLKRALEKRLAIPLAHHLLRRGTDDLAVVELLRRGDELALSVRVLARAAPVAVADATEWTLPRLVTAAREALARVHELMACDAAETLKEKRRKALAGRSAVPGGASIIDGLEALGARLERLLDESLDPEPFDEVDQLEQLETAPWKAAVKPRVQRRTVQYTVNAEAVVNDAAPQLRGALDELELLADRLRASGRGDETVTLLLEPVGPQSTEALKVVSELLLPAEKKLEAKRLTYVFHGPGAKAQVEPWLGYAQVAVKNEDGTSRRALVRLVRLEGEDGAVAAYDARQKAEREARRSGAEPAVDPFPRLVIERTETDGRAKFVATGLSDATEHLAACLRGLAK